MASNPNNCAICDRPPEDGVKMANAGGSNLQIDCPQCGQYVLVGEGGIWASYQWPPDLRPSWSCAARQASEARDPLKITARNASELAARHMNTRVSDNQERLLQDVAKRAERPHVEVQFSLVNDFTLIDCQSQEEFIWHMDWLRAQGLVAATFTASDQALVRLSLDGWNRVQPLPRPGGIPGRCFVAMWFSDATRAAYESGIEPAVSEAGFKPIRIDRKEHNNEIPDEIIAEIRNCQFMVADFTGQRAGVYYEAGFAVGLGRTVIWCCRKGEIGKLHFDTNHKNHIDWETPGELRERLYRRIRATILEQG